MSRHFAERSPDWDDEEWEPDFEDEQEWQPDDAEDDDTIPCPYCEEPIHEDSVQCPYCDNYLSEEEESPRPRTWIVVVTLICLAVVLFGWIL
ncbi:MAG: hypothetical protein R3B84_15530 [Zavarzinella sp.]